MASAGILYFFLFCKNYLQEQENRIWRGKLRKQYEAIYIDDVAMTKDLEWEHIKN